MDIQQIYQDLQGLNNLIVKINKRDKEAMKELNRLHKMLFGSYVKAGCSNCHIKAYQMLTSITIKDLENMENQKFKLKENVMLEFPARSGQFFTSVKGISNEIASEYLANFPNGISKFGVYPGSDSEKKEYTPLVAEIKEENVVENTEKSIEKMNKEELQAKFLEVKGVEADEALTKKELLAELQA